LGAARRDPRPYTAKALAAPSALNNNNRVMTHTTFRIGTRGSPLALAQAHEVRDRLAAAHPGRDLAVEIVVIRTEGDRVQDRTLAEIGGKGLFTKELEEALFDGRIDAAVHSMKDVPTWFPPGLGLGAILPREDPRDALISRTGAGLDALAPGSVVGTAGLRRQAQILEHRPDLVVIPFRGNVQTRLAKLAAGEADATLLALAGLNRLGMAHVASEILPVSTMLPAVAQGAIGVETRLGDGGAAALLAPLICAETTIRVMAERAFLAVLDGSCRTPIAALAELADGRVRIMGKLLSPDGSRVLRAEADGPAAEAEAVGREAGERILCRLPPGSLFPP
jgi:hydroxymethylbilane synthase